MISLRKFGSTELLVTPLGLGLAALGRPGYINLGHAKDLERDYEVDAMEARTHAVLDAAYESGIRYFDAARSYGRAEAFLGSWLHSRKINREEVTIGSKWGYTYTAGWRVDVEVHEVKEHSLPVLERQWAESRTNLGSHLALYQIHSATLESRVLQNQEVLEKLGQLKDEGVYIGLSVSGPKQPEVVDRAVGVEVNGVRLFDSIQATWNLLETSATESLAQAHQAGLGIIVKEALANGRLTDRNTSPEFNEEWDLLRTEAGRLDTTIDALALAGAIAQPWVDVTLSGAATIPHLQSNLKALDLPWNEEISTKLNPLVEAPDIYWKIRSKLAWN